VCCNVLQCVWQRIRDKSQVQTQKVLNTDIQSATLVTHYNTLQRAETHCNTLQHTATHCNTQGFSSGKFTLQRTATYCITLQRAATRCKTLQHAATRCTTLQHVAICCQTLQHTATHCNTLKTSEESLGKRKHCNTLQHIAITLQSLCILLQHIVSHLKECEKSLGKRAKKFRGPAAVKIDGCCSVLQQVAVCCHGLK